MTIRKFMDENFMLNNEVAVELYHNYAKGMPIFDFHCHLDPKDIAEDRKYRNMTELWLEGDHYKWRAMRSDGVEEAAITGEASDYEKFQAWAATMPNCIGNPLYHWTHLELKRYFGVDELLSERTAAEIWETCNRKLESGELTAREMIRRSNVKAICTTDDPVDSLEYHHAIWEDETFAVQVLPTFRPDKGMNIRQAGFVEWVEKLAEASGTAINGYEDYLTALEKRVEYFHQAGCRVSDHGLETVNYMKGSAKEAAAAFDKAMKGGSLTVDEESLFKTKTMLFLGSLYASKGWVMQLHIGPIRNNNARMFKELGPDAGFDSIGDSTFAEALSKLLSAMDVVDRLPKTILYCLNPRDNEVLGTMAGNFQGGGIPGKIQFGSGWWFNDNKDGMVRQMTALANLGVLSRFVGMLTDSRSFLSYTRHEYFRRILCNLIGEWVENGEAPDDMELLGTMVENISYRNAANYFDVEALKESGSMEPGKNIKNEVIA